MQTFMTSSDFEQTAKQLDYRRLGKQRVEAWQLLNGLTGDSGSGWLNHPAAKMWRGHERALAEYAIAICEEWVRRGYKDTLLPKFKATLATLPPCERPRWCSDERFLSSHRAALLAKDPEFYGKFGWVEEPRVAYFWPSREEPL